jgi:hypothetical protein
MGIITNYQHECNDPSRPPNHDPQEMLQKL